MFNGIRTTTRRVTQHRWQRCSSTSAETSPAQQQQQPQQQLQQNELATKSKFVESGEQDAQIMAQANSVGSVSCAAYKTSKKNYINALPKVPGTENIQQNELMLDVLFSSYQPLLQPVKSNHTRSPLSLSLSLAPKKFRTLKLQNSSILKDLENYKKIKAEKTVENYSPYFSKTKKFTPINSIFATSALNTQQHNLELFNLPLSYIESLKPFEAPNQPGDELYRDDMIYIRKLEIEEKKLQQKRLSQIKTQEDFKLAKKGLTRLRIENAEEFFGFK